MPLLQEIRVPLLSVNDTSLTVVDIPFTTGAKVKKGDIIMVFETSKTTFDVPAEADGYVKYFCSVDKDYNVNDLVASIFLDQAEVISTNGVAVEDIAGNHIAAKKETTEQHEWLGSQVFSLAAKSLINERKVNEAVFIGREFIGKIDVEAFLGIKKDVKQTNTKARLKPAAPFPTLDKITSRKLSSAKKREIEYLSAVQSFGLTSTVNTIVEMDGIFEAVNPSFTLIRNSILPIAIYETGRLLMKYKELNAFFTEEGTALYNDIHIGFAVDIEKGLKVLKIGKANEASVPEIEKAIIELSNKYLDDKLDLDDLSDITFTITDLSGETVSFFHPLVNMMNSAILGISSVDEKLNRCILSLTFDHRVTEGKNVARFLFELKSRLEAYGGKSASRVDIDSVRCFKCRKSLAQDLSDTGFAKCITPQGKEDFICQSCLKGF